MPAKPLSGGIILETGMVKITGRFKELIIGDGGENIAPVPIEDHVKASCDGINEAEGWLGLRLLAWLTGLDLVDPFKSSMVGSRSMEVMMIGDKRKYNVALITLKAC